VRNKNKIKNTPHPTPSSQAQLHSFTSNSSTLLSMKAQGERVVFSLQHYVSATPSSSHSSPTPAWGRYHGIQYFMNCSSVGSSHRLWFFKTCSSMGSLHRVQYFRNGLLHLGSPTGHSSCQERATVLAPLHSLQLPSGHIHLLQHRVLHGLQYLISAPP